MFSSVIAFNARRDLLAVAGVLGLAVAGSLAAGEAQAACGLAGAANTCPNPAFLLKNETPAPIWITTYNERGDQLDHFCSLPGHTDRSSKDRYQFAAKPVKVYIRVEGKNKRDKDCGVRESAFDVKLSKPVPLVMEQQPTVTLRSSDWTKVPTMN